MFSKVAAVPANLNFAQDLNVQTVGRGVDIAKPYRQSVIDTPEIVKDAQSIPW